MPAYLCHTFLPRCLDHCREITSFIPHNLIPASLAPKPTKSGEKEVALGTASMALMELQWDLPGCLGLDFKNLGPKALLS